MLRTGLAKVVMVGMMADCIKLGVVGITSAGRAHGHSNLLYQGDISVGKVDSFRQA